MIILSTTVKCDVKNRHVKLVGNIAERRDMFTDPNCGVSKTHYVGLTTLLGLAML
jgi:hypothetical protein